MKIKTLAILMIFSVLFAMGCSFQDKTEELKTGTYVMQGAKVEDWAWVSLNQENKFEFNRNIATSYRPSGTYSIEDDMLVLFVSENEIYNFKIEGEKIVFDSGKLAESFIEKGTIFELSEKK